MLWLSTSVTVERVAVDTIAALFSDYGKNGFTEEDVELNTDSTAYQEEAPNASNRVTVTFYKEWEPDANMTAMEKDNAILLWQEAVASICSINGVTVYGSPAVLCMDENDWQKSWKEYIHPFKILPNVVIQPAWQSYSKENNETVIKINSELSFGTGSHETTQCCAKLIALHGGGKRRILDVGTGTGILLLVAAAIYGDTDIELVGIDIDADCVLQAHENCEINAVKATILEGDLIEVYNEKADLILANLTGNPLKILLPICQQKLNENGILIISGIVDERVEELLPFITNNWKILEHIKMNNWNTFALHAL